MALNLPRNKKQKFEKSASAVLLTPRQWYFTNIIVEFGVSHRGLFSEKPKERKSRGTVPIIMDFLFVVHTLREDWAEICDCRLETTCLTCITLNIICDCRLETTCLTCITRNIILAKWPHCVRNTVHCKRVYSSKH
jgi:hypothetical protein